MKGINGGSMTIQEIKDELIFQIEEAGESAGYDEGVIEVLMNRKSKDSWVMVKLNASMSEINIEHLIFNIDGKKFAPLLCFHEDSYLKVCFEWTISSADKSASS